MAKPYTKWTVHAHGALQQLGDNLWSLDGTVPDIGLPRRMVIVRLADGRLIIHNLIAADESAMLAIEALGEVAFLVVPSGYHRLDAAVFRQRYPQAKLLAPRGAAGRIVQVVAVDGTLDDLPTDPRVRAFHLAGVKEHEGAMIVDEGGGASVVMNDALFNMPKTPGAFGYVYGGLMGNYGKPKVTTIFKTFVLADRAAFKAQLQQLADVPGLRRVLVGHGAPIEGDAAGALRAAAAEL